MALPVSACFVDREAKTARGPKFGKVDTGEPAELYWKPGMTLVSRGEKTAMAALFTCMCKPWGLPPTAVTAAEKQLLTQLCEVQQGR